MFSITHFNVKIAVVVQSVWHTYYPDKSLNLLYIPLFTILYLLLIAGLSDPVMEGLYVVDGSILPVAVGVNPTLTISCLAERCMRLLAKREGWQIDCDTFKPHGEAML